MLFVMQWLHLYQRFYEHTAIRVVSECATYRRLAKTLPTKQDTVLEIGCAKGLTTEQLAATAKHVIAVDTSYTEIDDAQLRCAHHVNVKFLRSDGRDLELIQQQAPSPNLIFIDIGGDAYLGNVASLLRTYLHTFSPRLWIVRSIELALVTRMITDVELPEKTSQGNTLVNPVTDSQIEHLIELSHSEITSDRLFAVRKLKKLNRPAAFARLAEMINDPNAQIRKICQHPHVNALKSDKP